MTMHSSIVVIVFGLPGSGKSYFASRLAYKLNAFYINSDRIRKEHIPKRTYSFNEKISVYEEMLAKTKEALKQNRNIVVDATFFKKAIRERFFQEAAEETPLFFIEVIASETLIGERLKNPRPDSEADFDVYEILKSQWEPMPEPHLILESTDDNIADMLRRAADYLHLDNDKGTDT